MTKSYQKDVSDAGIDLNTICIPSGFANEGELPRTVLTYLYHPLGGEEFCILTSEVIVV